MKKYLNIIYLLLIILILSFGVGYYFYFLPNIPALLNGEAPTFLQKIVEYFYPRILVEKHRFSVEFFVSKANQVFVRGNIFVIIILAFSYLYQKNIVFNEQWKSFWTRKVQISYVNWSVSLYYVGMLYYMSFWQEDFPYFPHYESFYKPISFLSWFNLPFPPVWLNWVMFSVIIVSSIFCIFRRYLFLSSLITTFIFLISQAYYQSFEKIDHGFTTFGYAALLMPFVAWERKKAIRYQQVEMSGWAIWLIQVSVVMSYFLSGMEKITVGGLSWLEAEHLSTYLLFSNTSNAKWLLQYPFLIQMFSIFIVIFQLFSPLILFFRRFTVFFLMAGITFHSCTKFFMDVGIWLSPWIWVYVFFYSSFGRE